MWTGGAKSRGYSRNNRFSEAESGAIEMARTVCPEVSQRGLATKLTASTHRGGSPILSPERIALLNRSYHSVYHAIRRYDAKQRPKPAPEPAQESHQQARERLQLQTGDKVRVVRKAESGENGWNTAWISVDMDRAIGRIGVVGSTGLDDLDAGVTLFFEGSRDASDYRYPAHVLEVVERAEREAGPIRPAEAEVTA